MSTEAIVLDNTENSKLFSSLIKKSLKDPMDYHNTINWSLGFDKSKPSKRFDQVWLYHSPVWNDLTEEQKIELTWLETARDISMFINLEHLIPELYAGFLRNQPERMTDEVYKYLMIFSREELMHILTFNRYLEESHLPKHPKMDYFYKLADQLQGLRPETGITFTLLIEWLAENKAMISSQSEEVDPLTAELWHAHHEEEIRHIAFGKKIAETYFEHAPEEELSVVREQLAEMVRRIVHATPIVEDYASFALPESTRSDEFSNLVRASTGYKEMIEGRYHDIFDWCESLGISVRAE